MSGWSKVENACAVALQKHQCEWLWMDTCCIDKGSSAELSEAINSMFTWYLRSKICLAYLNDVPTCENLVERIRHMRASRWFTRGWTLQELIAPAQDVVFLSKDWVKLGTRCDLASFLADLTQIDRGVLVESGGRQDWHLARLRAISVAERMSWAAGRDTTRPEDKAYSLMGLFDVNMPVLYGEGADKAFRRLQQEIIRDSFDHSIFAWGVRSPSSNFPPWPYYQPKVKHAHSDKLVCRLFWSHGALLASSPDDFRYSAGLKGESLVKLTDALRLSDIGEPHFYPTNYGIRIQLPLCFLGARDSWQLYHALLACSTLSDPDARIGLLLLRIPGTDVYYCMNISDLEARSSEVRSRAVEHSKLSLQSRRPIFPSAWKLSTIYIRDYVPVPSAALWTNGYLNPTAYQRTSPRGIERPRPPSPYLFANLPRGMLSRLASKLWFK
ncbi:hypothetical protein C8Q70DRAFT_311003 [Cubamyces menziesii]|nr:hypothetical protein C8Q70DRAFT_311003 [Cubamyces menziesii]